MALIGSYLYDIGSDDYASCCVSAENTLLNIENEVVHDEDKERQLRMVENLWGRLHARLEEVGKDSPEGQLAAFFMEYLSLTKAFLRNTYGVRYAGIRFDSEKLLWYAEAFEKLRNALPKLPEEYRDGAERRIALAAKWCRDRHEYIQDFPGVSPCSEQKTGQQPRHPVSSKPGNKIPAGICGILLGAFGVHKFILGYTTPGVIMLLATILTCGYGGVIVGIIGVIEGIIYLTQSDEQFNQKYITNKRLWF